MLGVLLRPVRTVSTRRQPQRLVYRPARAVAVLYQGCALLTLALGVKGQGEKAKRVVRILVPGVRAIRKIRLRRARVKLLRGFRANLVRPEPRR